MMKNKLYVWDPLIRISHWALVLAFITSYLTGEDESNLHIYSGYLILLLITVRVIWGFVGSKHARFKNFIRSPADAIRYIRGLFDGNCQHYVGHNPAGGLMVIALMLSILCTGVSGLILHEVEGEGPLSSGAFSNFINLETTDHKVEDHDDEQEEFWEELHEFFANFTIFLIVLHIAGVLMSSFRHKENLVKAMINGYKTRSS